MDLHKTLCKFHELLIVTGVQEPAVQEPGVQEPGVQESPGQKLDWLPFKRLLSSKYLKNELNVIFSNILPQTSNNAGP